MAARRQGARGVRPRDSFAMTPIAERIECLDARPNGSVVVVCEHVRFARPIGGSHLHLRRCRPGIGWEYFSAARQAPVERVS